MIWFYVIVGACSVIAIFASGLCVHDIIAFEHELHRVKDKMVDQEREIQRICIRLSMLHANIGTILARESTNANGKSEKTIGVWSSEEV